MTSLTSFVELNTNNVHLTLAKEEAAELARILARKEEADQILMDTKPSEDTAMSVERHREEEEEQIFVVHHEIGPSAMILQGVELESNQ